MDLTGTLASTPPGFPFHDAVSKRAFITSGAITQKKAEPRKERVEKAFQLPLELARAPAWRVRASPASRASAALKRSFTANTEGDVFYVYVKRQFVSTVISADECL